MRRPLDADDADKGEQMEHVLKIALMIAVTWIIAECIKVCTESFKQGRFTIRPILSFGGMPSAHSTFVFSIMTSIYLVEGFTTSFLLSIAFAIIVMRDLVTIRKLIDSSAAGLAALSKRAAPRPISHTKSEIITGIALGIILPMLLFFIL